MSADGKTIRIGGASGFWGESSMSTPQLLQADLDYIVYDYLAEITMSIMARSRLKDPKAGYARDFVSVVLKQNLHRIAEGGVKVLSNAGGVNPVACAEAVRALIKEQQLPLKVAVITGDDLLEQKEALAKEGIREMFSGTAFPSADSLASINAYLGAFPLAKALDEGADIVICGRCVDSAVTLAAAIHSFGWQPHQWDLLAAGSLAGHIIECGPQATGGNFTDWDRIGPEGTAEIGYPIAEIAADGIFVCSKPKDTGGEVSVGTVSEQLLYEIGDPQSYLLPDVCCDFSEVHIEPVGDNRVRVSGAKGRPPPPTLKVSATFFDGFRAGTTMSFVGVDAEGKARGFAQALFQRCRTQLRAANMPDFEETSVEIIGAESQYGSARRIESAREVVLKFAVRHETAQGAGLVLREATGLGLATPPGLSGFAGARPSPSPVVRLFSFTATADRLQVSVDLEGETLPCPAAPQSEAAEVPAPHLLQTAASQQAAQEAMTQVPLVALAWGRSGDKGNNANIGIIARKAEYLPYLWTVLGIEQVRECFAHFLEPESRVERFLLPGSNAINFVLHRVLGGGGIASLRNDAQGKAYAQILLDHPIAVPESIAAKL